MGSTVLFSLCSLLLLAYLVPKTESYSFDNHELNEHLRQRLEEYKYLAEEESRGKRHAKDVAQHDGYYEHDDDDDQFVCKPRDFKSCCGDDNLMEKFIDDDKSVGKACYESVTARMEDVKGKPYDINEPTDYYSCQGLQNMKKKIYCLNECIGKRQQLVYDDGSLNANKVREVVLAVDYDETWEKDLVTNSLFECLDKGYYKSSVTKAESSPKDLDLDCNPTYLQFLNCMYKEIQTGCPVEYQKNSKKCTAIRDRYANNQNRNKRPAGVVKN